MYTKVRIKRGSPGASLDLALDLALGHKDNDKKYGIEKTRSPGALDLALDTALIAAVKRAARHVVRVRTQGALSDIISVLIITKY
jgi:hypothetical protein